jgi:DNA replication and repair protein RecF
MNLSRLTLRAFRNVSSMEISFAPGCNVVHGSNAQGKTNLLEAIYLLGTLKSFRMARNAELIGRLPCLWSRPARRSRSTARR